MTEPGFPNEPGAGPPDRSDESVAALLKATGRRPPVPPERAARVHTAVRDAWLQATQRRVPRRKVWIGAALTAAAVLVGVAGLWMLAGRHREPLLAPPILVERVVGNAWSRPLSSDVGVRPVPLREGERIDRGVELSTAEGGRVALRMGGGVSARFDAGTRVRVLSADTIALDAGAVYVDSVPSVGPRGGSIEVRTAFATLRNLGTQFEVRRTAASLVVRVRDGRVALDARGTAVVASAGEVLQVHADGRTERLDPAPSGALWAWFEDVTPMMDIEGRRLVEFLEWMGRERGLSIRFATPELAASGSKITLNGSVRGLTLDQALASVLATCGLSYRIDGGALVLAPAPES